MSFAAVTAALARVHDADARRDAALITRELKAWLGSEFVVLRCCEALQNVENARAADASADALLLVLEALRRHARCAAVVNAAWGAVTLLQKGTNAKAIRTWAIEHGALELAVAFVRDESADMEIVTTSLAAFCCFTCPHHVSRAVHLGGVEVRFVV